MTQLLIVGAGASGMAAAILASRKGIQVTILERNSLACKKIYATGNGRCNYTNANLSYHNFHGSNPMFVASAIGRFGHDQIVAFFQSLGIMPSVFADGRTYPLSYQASSVAKVLIREVSHLGVTIEYNCCVNRIEKTDKFVATSDDGRKFQSDMLILATGGKAMPKSGSDGLGYQLAAGFGHRLTKTHPGIVQLRLKSYSPNGLNGTKILGAVSLVHKGKTLRREQGDILFTDYGISGPTILQVSRTAISLRLKQEQVFLRIDVIPTLTEDKLRKLLKDRSKQLSHTDCRGMLIGLVHDNLIEPLLTRSQINGGLRTSELSNQNIHHLARVMKNWELEVDTYKSENDGQVTCGGIDIREINPNTMESKLIENLYFTGEIMDVDGDCGGYNLHWAWASAMAFASHTTL